jgi:hypothetical protein
MSGQRHKHPWGSRMTVVRGVGGGEGGAGGKKCQRHGTAKGETYLPSIPPGALTANGSSRVFAEGRVEPLIRSITNTDDPFFDRRHCCAGDEALKLETILQVQKKRASDSAITPSLRKQRNVQVTQQSHHRCANKETCK